MLCESRMVLILRSSSYAGRAVHVEGTACRAHAQAGAARTARRAKAQGDFESQTAVGAVAAAGRMCVIMLCESGIV